MQLLLLLLCIANIYINVAAYREHFRTIYQWRYFDYKWKNASHKAAAIATGDYDYTQCVIIDADYSKDGRVFVTIIRNNGVSSSLNVISRQKGPGGLLLQPYPNWEWTKRGDCNGITNVFRIAIDRCNRLWVLDSGTIGKEVICPAQLLVFNLVTNKLIKRVKIANNLSQNSKTKIGLLVTIVLETYGPRCSHTTVYMADTTGYGLVIYDSDSEKVWQLESEIFRLDPTFENYTVRGESFQLRNGILGMAKHPYAPVLYFRPMSSRNINSARTTDLKKSRYGAKVHYYTIRDVFPSQATAMAISSDGVLFFGLPTELSVACWNTCKPFNENNLGIAGYDPDRFQFASCIKIIPKDITGAREELWIVTNRFQKVMAGTLNFTEVNFRIMKADVMQLTDGTVCALP
ncbi:major royal jelly protein 1-like [Polyergus mexicanus]|uniref:major royal jelly protein 1-like n=1 Tax=Polyergus mexicanus TaxID=615972 RepID=UPI0038B5AC0D